MDTMDVDRADDSFYAKLFIRAPIYDLVFACLSPRALIQVALTCRAGYTAVAAFKSRAFNVNHHFSRYFTDPIMFRSLQAKTNTLVSGSNALQFLDRTFYPEADLDLYTHPGHSFEVSQFLVEKEGYYFVPRGSQEEDWKDAIDENWDGTQRRVEVPGNSDRAYPNRGIRHAWTFGKTNASGEQLTVQIIEAMSSPLESILGFHSTCVMNFISSDAAYSLYPIATFEERCALGMPGWGHSEIALQKYIQRGWRLYFMPTPDHMANPTKPPFLPDVVRWVTDAHTWIVLLDQTGVQQRVSLSPASAPLTCDPAVFNGWWLSPGKCYSCDYYPVQATVFRYNYAIPDERIQHAIRRWADLQGKASHMRIAKADWVWFDADLPTFLRAK